MRWRPNLNQLRPYLFTMTSTCTPPLDQLSFCLLLAAPLQNTTPRILGCTPPRSLPSRQPNSITSLRKLTKILPILESIPKPCPHLQTSTPVAATSASSPLLQDHFATQGFKTKDTFQLVEGESPAPNPLGQPTPNPHWRTMLPNANSLQKGPFRKQDTNHSFTQEA